MPSFIDGPAAGLTLSLRRAPVMLRVVQGPRTSWDALDQPDDVATAGERIHVYRWASRKTVFFVRASKGMGGRWPECKYRLFEPQPADALVRGNAAWLEWCDSIQAGVEELLVKEGIITRDELTAIRELRAQREEEA